MRQNRGVNQSNMNLQGAIDLGAVAAAREAQAKAAQAEMATGGHDADVFPAEV